MNNKSLNLVSFPFLILFLSCGLPREKQTLNSSKELTKDANPEVRSDLLSDSTFCNTNTLLFVERNIEKLTKTDIDSFLKTFHSDCINNVEFSEWSNELLYKVLETYTETTIELLETKKHYYLKAILSDLESPIHDGIMPRPIIVKIEKLVNQARLPSRY